MSLTRLERETVITMNDGEDLAEVYTAQRSIITRLKKNPAARLIEEGVFDGSVWARFEIAKGLISFRSVRVKRPGAGRTAADMRAIRQAANSKSEQAEAA